MFYEKYQWTNRDGTNLHRRTLTDVTTGDVETVDVSRDEGAVYSQGIQFNASTMNDIETRIKQAFDRVQAEMDAVLNTFYPVGSVYMSMSNVSPATLFGGTWVSLTRGLLLPSNTAGTEVGRDSIPYTPSGGVAYSGRVEKALADLPNHTHSRQISDIPARNAADYIRSSGADFTSDLGRSVARSGEAGWSTPHDHPFYGSGAFSGSAMTLDNRMASTTVYAWKRTA